MDLRPSHARASAEGWFTDGGHADCVSWSYTVLFCGGMIRMTSLKVYMMGTCISGPSVFFVKLTLLAAHNSRSQLFLLEPRS